MRRLKHCKPLRRAQGRRSRLSQLPSPRMPPLPRIGRTRLLLFLAMLGPGLITANADNDAGGIATYSIAGARYGYGMLWMLLLITFSLAVTQEMGARMGVVTGQGLAALIRERFRLKLTVVRHGRHAGRQPGHDHLRVLRHRLQLPALRRLEILHGAARGGLHLAAGGARLLQDRRTGLPGLLQLST